MDGNLSLRKKLARTSTIVSGLALAAVGLAVGAFGINELTRADASASWPSVGGTVVSSHVKKSTSSRGTGRNRRRSTSHRAVVIYQYTLAGRTHTARRLSFGATDSSASTARQVVSRYPAGTAVTVFYDPDDPDQATLETGTTSGTYLPLGIGITLAAVGAFMAIGGLHARKTLQSPTVPKTPGSSSS